MDQPDKTRKRMPLQTSGPHDVPVNHQPLWAKGLEEIYASVVNEPLPESFNDLLDMLDKQPPVKKSSDD
jgi:Anti-sigma factor NepR